MGEQSSQDSNSICKHSWHHGSYIHFIIIILMDAEMHFLMLNFFSPLQFETPVSQWCNDTRANPFSNYPSKKIRHQMGQCFLVGGDLEIHTVILPKNKYGLPQTSTDGGKHGIQGESRSTKSAWFSMLYSSKSSNVTQEPRQEGIVAYCWAITYNCYMLACSCYCYIHPPTITQKPNSPEVVWSNLQNMRCHIL